jgi:Glucosamine-6-phosphate isomerases/6-phosphogluconolactonase
LNPNASYGIAGLRNYKLPISNYQFRMPSTRSIEVVATAADLFHCAAEEFVGVGRTAIGAQGRFTVALSGGSTPKALY